MTLCISPDASLQRVSGSMVLSNQRARKHVELDANAAAAVALLGNGVDERQWVSALEKTSGWNRTVIPGSLGLVFDHSGLGPERGQQVSGQKLFELLVTSFLVVKEGEEAAYNEFLRVKESPLDQTHLGSFHQNVGQYQTLYLRNRHKWRAWHDQKFSPDGLTVKSGPYKAVQETFLRGFIDRMDLPGAHLLDFGCGNGFYTHLFAEHGAVVTGIDTSPELIEMARHNCSASIGSTRFLLVSGPEEVVPSLKAEEAGSLDAIFMSDVMLLLLRGEQDGKEVEGLDNLLLVFSQLLRPGGKIYSMEPNPIFWHACRAGSKERPYAVVPEYRNPIFNVSPTYDQVINRFSGNGFLVEHFYHLYDDEMEGPDNGCYANEFPIWDFIVYRKQDRSQI